MDCPILIEGFELANYTTTDKYQLHLIRIQKKYCQCYFIAICKADSKYHTIQICHEQNSMYRIFPLYMLGKAKLLAYNK